MGYLVRLDVDKIRLNLARTTGRTPTDEDLHRWLAERGVWRRDSEWWGAKADALLCFGDGEVLEQRAREPG